MRNILVLSTVGSVLTLGLSSFGVAAAEPTALQGLVQKVQSGGEKAPGARGQEGGGKGTAPGSREGGGGPGAAQDKGAGPEKGAKGAGAEKGDGGQKADRGTQMRSGEKGTRDGQRRTERGGRTGVDVDVRGGRGDRNWGGQAHENRCRCGRGRRARGGMWSQRARRLRLWWRQLPRNLSPLPAVRAPLTSEEALVEIG